MSYYTVGSSKLACKKAKLKRKILSTKGKRLDLVKPCTNKQRFENLSEENEMEFEESFSKSHKHHLSNLQDTDPDFYQFLLENDKKLLDFSESEDEDDLQSEPIRINECDQEDDAANDSADDEDGDVNSLEGKIVTAEMIHGWSEKLIKDHSVKSLKQLCLSLHCGVAAMLSSNSTSIKHFSYQVNGSQVFNVLVVACLRYVRPTLEHHFPIVKKGHHKPSSLNNWGRMKLIIKTYLTDILKLLHNVAEKSMICTLLRHIEGVWCFFSCFPQLSRYLTRDLIMLWSESSGEVSVLAYLMLRKTMDDLKEFKLEDMLKRMYLAYVRNSRLTTPSTLQHIQFMCGTLVEVLSFRPGLAYQLVFLYTRHLANQLRRAFKGNKAVSVASWPFIHSLVLFTTVLSTLQNEIFSPLVYPVTQVSLGVVQLLSASKFVPLRLHIVEILLEISDKRGTFIPLAPILLEVFETHAINISSKEVIGKLPNLSSVLKLSKIQIGSRATQTAVLNYTLELLLRLLSLYSNYISFPEIVFPIVTRLRKVMKRTPLTWLRHHLKQIIEKTNEVGKCIANDRSSVDFSPKDDKKIKAWEVHRASQKNSLVKFYETWKVVQQQAHKDGNDEEDHTRDEIHSRNEAKEQVVKRKRKRESSGDKSCSVKQKISDLDFHMSDLENEGEDILEELQLYNNSYY